MGGAMRFILQLQDASIELLRAKHDRPRACQAKGCFDVPKALVKPTHPRTIELLGKEVVWLCEDHARIEAGGPWIVRGG
jgi:hypothetical protein